MPELPDVVVYLERLTALILGARLLRVRVVNPFVLRSVSPAPDDFAGRRIVALRRLGKRIVIGVEGDLFIVIHLMIAGRLRWRAPGRGPTDEPVSLARVMGPPDCQGDGTTVARYRGCS